MPLYEYQCDVCAHRFEKIQKYSDPVVDTCPVCGGLVRKLQSSPAIQFKGSGFYITDYAKKDQGGGEKSDGGSADTAAKSDSGSSKSDKTDKTEKSDKLAAPAASEKSKSSSSAASSSDSSAAASTKQGTAKPGT
jgi:putative FmdB family regulatory protein